MSVTAGADPQSIPMMAFSANIAAYAGTTVRLSVDENVQLYLVDAAFDNFVISGAPSLQLTVNNVDPTLSGLSATPILDNGTTMLSGTIADVGTLDTFTVEIDWGGAGDDHLNGGSARDILIGGTTDYDDDYDALLLLLANSSPLTSSTVHDDDAIDTLTGSAGIDLFFAQLDGANKDKITDSAESLIELP